MNLSNESLMMAKERAVRQNALRSFVTARFEKNKLELKFRSSSVHLSLFFIEAFNWKSTSRESSKAAAEP